jgi:uridine monophosphate synthetase
VSPIYIDLRRLVGFPKLLSQVAKVYVEILSKIRFDHIGALPYAALPIASSISLQTGWSMIYPRKETKEYGTKAQIEGVYHQGQKVVIIDDLISTGGSKFEGIHKLESAGLVVEDVVVLLDRSSDGATVLKEKGYLLHSVMRIADLLAFYEKNGMVDNEKIAEAKVFLNL